MSFKENGRIFKSQGRQGSFGKFLGILRSCCATPSNASHLSLPEEGDSTSLNYKVLVKLDKKVYNFTKQDSIKAVVTVDVTPGLYTNQNDPSIRINIDSVTCTLKACARIGKTSACKELATLSEDISQEALSKKDKGFYQIFTRTF